MPQSAPPETTQPKFRLKDRLVVMGFGGGVLTALAILTPLGIIAAFIAAFAVMGFVWVYGSSHNNAAQPDFDNSDTNNNSDGDSNSPRALEARGESRLADSLQEALIIINSQEQIEFINKEAQKLFPQGRKGAALTSIVRDIKILTQIRDVTAGKPAAATLITLSTPVERFFRVVATALHGASEDRSKSAGHSEQSAPRRRIVIALQDVTDLERANLVQADFLANASHELKTPVASLLGYIETLRGHARDDPEAQNRFLGIMQTQAERMQRLIDDLLSLRRIEQTEHIAPTEKGDFALAARTAIEALAPLSQARGVDVIYEGESQLLVRGNQDELVQLILNIIDNAVKMSPRGSAVTISAALAKDWKPEDAFAGRPLTPSAVRRRIISPSSPGRDHAVLRISDSGPGFTKEHLPRIGERFYRIAGDRESRSRGTGLGLAIVKHITLRHRGGLMVESAPNIGTQFTLIMPSAETRPSPEATKS